MLCSFFIQQGGVRSSSPFLVFLWFGTPSSIAIKAFFLLPSSILLCCSANMERIVYTHRKVYLHSTLKIWDLGPTIARYNLNCLSLCPTGIRVSKCRLYSQYRDKSTLLVLGL